MLKINIITIGKIKDKYIIDGINEYSKRLSKFVKLNFLELVEEIDNDTSIEKESNRILEKLEKSNSYNILLDIQGKQLTSVELSNYIEKIQMTNSEISFIIGGSKGVSEKLKNYCDFRLSFSKMTFPHQLFKLILLEQIYRVFSIINNIKYHK